MRPRRALPVALALLAALAARGRARAGDPPPPAVPGGPAAPSAPAAPAAPGAPAPAPAPASKPSARPAPTSVPAADVVAAIARAAIENAAKPEGERASGDALFDLYVRRGAAVARGDVPGFLLGLAKAIDPVDSLGRFPLTARATRGLETEAEAAARRAALGKPTLRGRDDRALHFVVSAALAARLGEAAANAAGLAKELADLETAEKFSVGDLLADAAGVVFARRLAAGDAAANLAWVAAAFAGADAVPDDAGLPDALSKEEFARAYGGPSDPRLLELRARLFASAEALAYPKAAAPGADAGGGGGEGRAPTPPAPGAPAPPSAPRPTK